MVAPDTTIEPPAIARARDLIGRLTCDNVPTVVHELATAPPPSNPDAYMVGVLMAHLTAVLDVYDQQATPTTVDPDTLPGCHVYGCDRTAPVLDINRHPVCTVHDTRYQRGVA